VAATATRCRTGGLRRVPLYSRRTTTTASNSPTSRACAMRRAEARTVIPPDTDGCGLVERSAPGVAEEPGRRPTGVTGDHNGCRCRPHRRKAAARGTGCADRRLSSWAQHPHSALPLLCIPTAAAVAARRCYAGKGRRHRRQRSPTDGCRRRRHTARQGCPATQQWAIGQATTPAERAQYVGTQLTTRVRVWGSVEALPRVQGALIQLNTKNCGLFGLKWKSRDPYYL